MGYIRSSVRLDWHITEIMHDATPWAAAPSLTYAVGMVLLNVAIFWFLAVLIFWAGSGRKLALPSKAIEGSGELPETNESLPS
ncbi:MAG: hypothetical protein MPW15_10335 [Candidatus Manganitrophus sp.]|nr:hypothetical protein [Candidatus Manganitrophus sp.]